MKKLKTLLMTYLFIGVLPFSTYSQSIVCQVIGTTGGSAQIGDKIISYALGESVISTIGSANNIISQGFFQPDKIPVGTLSIGGKEDIDITIFPNPTQNQLHIELSSLNPMPDLEIQILNALGQAMTPIQVIHSPSVQTIECQQLPAGYYFLKINSSQQNQQEILSFVKIDN